MPDSAQELPILSVRAQLLTSSEGKPMLRWALIFFVIAIVAAIFGFGGLAGEAAWIGKLLLVVFLILAVLSIIFGRRSTV
jgi:uncharacterized membrane protein YtjA (UPF0391 family)